MSKQLQAAEFVWPKRPDGSNMSLGEMSRDERRAAFRHSCQKLQREFANPKLQQAMNKAIKDATDGIA